eukprot:2525794-Karenia_brevis.AAC.1
MGLWYSLDEAGIIKRGDKVDLSIDAAVLGDKALMNVAVDGINNVISLERVRRELLSDWKKQKKIEVDDDTDARVLPILRKGTARHRPFKSAADKWEQITFSAWRVPGPRT